MKKNILTAALAAALSCPAAFAGGPAIPKDPEIEARIDRLLEEMTLEEKIGQMTQLTIDMVTDWQTKELSEEMLDNVIGKYKVGSILNVPGGASPDREKYREIITRIQEKSMEEIGIPCIYGLDQIHGATYVDGATFFPQGINVAATFNSDYATAVGEVTAYETRAAMVPWTFSPTMDLGRDPRWPRMWESYGEDPLVNAVMATAAVKGMQGDDPNHLDLYHIAACTKHFMAYGMPVTGKDRTPSSVTPSELREKHFAPFKASLQAGALTLMVNSASNNGLPFHANKELLTGWVKEDLGWDGLIVTDWADINNLYTREHIAEDQKDAIRIAINAGIDMSMVPYDPSFCDDLKALVEEGAVPMSRIDDAVRRVLRLKFRLGLFENPVWDAGQYPKFASEEFTAKAYAAALESEVLLKNEGGLLPLKEGVKILVTGPNGNSMRTLNGGWSYTWQGDRTDEFAEEYNTIYEALANRFGKDKVNYVAGVRYSGSNWQDEDAGEIDKAVAAAAEADVIIACIGENSYCETPGNMNDLNLSAGQKELVRALAETGKPLVLVLNSGRPRIIGDIEPLADAVVNVMLPSNYGGDAFAALVSGDENFSGRLPYTYPKYINSLATYDYKVSENVATMAGAYNYDAKMDIQWPFGHGLSYTEFEYSDFRADRTEFTADDEIVFTVKVKNSGKVAGKEAVMLYSSDLVASSVPDVIRLRAFDKIELQPGESTEVSFTLKGSDLAFVNYYGKWTLEKGGFRMRCGDQVLNINCTETKLWETPNID